jgi:integrase
VSLNGRRLTHYAKTQRECQEWIREIQAQIDEGLTIDGARATLGEYLEQWLESAKPSWRPSTRRQFSRLVRQYITPGLGTVRLKDLRPDQIQSFYTNQQEAGASVPTIRAIHTVLHRSLNQALKWGLITRNPASAVDKPKLKHREMSILDADQTKALLDVVKGERFEALYHMAVTTGLREGELLGLRWADLDWETRRLQVQRKLERVRGQGLVFSEPKSDTGRRSVVLGAVVLEKLKEHRERQEQQRLIAGKRWQEHNLIFPSTIGTPKDPRDLRREFKALLQRAGLPEHPKVVQERLGHSTISLTLDTYSHVLPSLQEDAADKLDSLLQ